MKVNLVSRPRIGSAMIRPSRQTATPPESASWAWAADPMRFLYCGLPLRAVDQRAKPPIESGRDAQAAITAPPQSLSLDPYLQEIHDRPWATHYLVRQSPRPRVDRPRWRRESTWWNRPPACSQTIRTAEPPIESGCHQYIPPRSLSCDSPSPAWQRESISPRRCGRAG